MNKCEKLYQKGLKQIKEGTRLSPLRAIRLKCLDCSGWSEAEVRKCVILDCALYKFRFGRNMTGKNPSKRR